MSAAAFGAINNPYLLATGGRRYFRLETGRNPVRPFR